ncbi:hypothetical protein DXG01_002375 [Tephrocybe rancida]|nr:hypothetical protein DXG01_002375 [Tephrocybe rancida]
MQNEVNGVIKARASFKTFATDLEVTKKTLTAFLLHVPFPGYLDGSCCYTNMVTLRSGLVSGMAKRLHPTNFARPFLWPWTDKEKSYKKGTAKYKAIPIIETGEGTVGPSITIMTTLDAKRNCEAYALQRGKVVPIESDHESDPENDHISVVKQNEQPIARLPSRAPPPQQMGTRPNAKKCRCVDSGSDDEATPKKVMRQKEADQIFDDDEQNRAGSQDYRPVQHQARHCDDRQSMQHQDHQYNNRYCTPSPHNHEYLDLHGFTEVGHYTDDNTALDGIVLYVVNDDAGFWNVGDDIPLLEIGLLHNNDS